MKKEKEIQFLEMIRSNKGLILHVCSIYAVSRDELRDLYQDVLLNTWKAYDSYRGESKCSTWLYRIALNTAIMNFRKSSRNRISVSAGFEIPDIADPEISAGPDDFLLLHDAIRQLPEIDRAIILLYLEEQPGEEISRITGLSTVNIRVRINRIKKRLRTILEKQGYQIN